MAEFKSYSVQLAAGDALTLEYAKDSSGTGNDDCVWLKDFTVALPHSVIFHANDGTDATASQSVFGTANLTANTFTREGYRFDGWATRADSSEVAYADGASVTLNDADLDLYAVWTKVWRVTFPNLPQGAALTVKNAAGQTLTAASDGSYIPVSYTHLDVYKRQTVTYTYTLHEGLKWSDGEPLTAGDFVFAWNRAASAALGADYGYMMEVIDGYAEVSATNDDGTPVNPDAKLNVEAPDDRTLVVTLTNYVPYWNELLAFPVYFPAVSYTHLDVYKRQNPYSVEGLMLSKSKFAA